MTSKVTIYTSEMWTVTSHGNGWAYELACAAGGSLWVQDDDATGFRNEWTSLEAAYPNTQTDVILCDLWDQYTPDDE